MCLSENLKIVKDYRDHLMSGNSEKSFSPYTSIRHCLYLSDQEVFGRMLYKGSRQRFAAWLQGL